MSEAIFGAPYSAKRHGVTITNCDAEPVHIPGCVQGHGALLVLRPNDLTIRQVSENSAAVMGTPWRELLGQTLAAALGSELDHALREFLAQEQTLQNPLYVTSLPARGQVAALDVIVHTLPAGPIVLELEPSQRRASEPDYYALVKKTLSRVQQAVTLKGLCQDIADEVRALTGHDRVMIYRFHADAHGEVFAESKRADLAAWVGLHYPAEDIPRPARAIFEQIWVRPLVDAHAPLAELVPLVDPETQEPLLMTHCALRGASVMYTEYVQNMGVRATLTMSLRMGETLWGLIACHHYSAPRPVPYQVRAACELLAQVASLQLKAADDREQLLYRLHIEGVHNELVARAAHEAGITSIMDGDQALLNGLSAGGAALHHDKRWFTAGVTPSESQLNDLVQWLSQQPQLESPTNPLYATNELSRVYPEAAEFAAIGSGLLAFPLSLADRTLVMWFRPETVQTIHWGGNPNDKPMVLGPNGPRLTPRTSFELFVESVRQRALPWQQVELDAAARLRLLLIDLVVTRAERLAQINADMRRSQSELDSFVYIASHDLKEPLRGIHKYAHQLQDELTQASEDQARRLQALVRLTQRMDSLLDSLLHFSRVGTERLDLELTDLDSLISEAVEMVGSRIRDVSREIVLPRAMPRAQVDRVRAREIFVNLISNALKYNDKPETRIEVGYIAQTEQADRTHHPEGTESHTIYYVRDNGIGIDPSHFVQVFRLFKRLHGRDDFGGGTGAGLSIVKKLVERHHGTVWLTSELGIGSTFYFTLPGKDES